MEYQPDPSALSPDLWSEVYLVSLLRCSLHVLLELKGRQSNRDLAYQVPINFVTHPGVSVTAACFGNRTYSAVAAAKCISNLLAAQYRRFVLDVYWDASARRFGLCPVELPSSGRATTRIVPSPSALTSAHISSVRLTRSTSRLEQGHPVQATPAPSSAPFNATAYAAPTSTSSPIPVESVIGSSGEMLFSLGSYQCSEDLDIQNISPLILGYLQNTSDTIHAQLLWLEFNLHAAASSNAPDEPANAPPNSALPSVGQLVGQEMNSTMQAYIYTPSQLASDRSNLNESWYHGPSLDFPDPGYYNTMKQVDGTISTPDGWPTERYVQLTKLMRMLLGWGTVDPQMANYSFSGDAGTVFPQGYLSESIQIEANSAGQVTSGCFFDPSVTTVSKLNSSWALSSFDQNAPVSALASNLAACGISPILNVTLGGTSADSNATPYTSFSRSAIWNWAPGEPRNNSTSGFDEDYPQAEFRCAIMDVSAAYLGLWRVEDCPNKHRAACRIDNQPYEWTLSSNNVSFYDAPYSCPSDSSFSAPRTGLENHHLHQTVLSSRLSIGTTQEAKGIWINFNSLDTATCWVATGPNGTCPYYVDESAQQSRQILVPTIGAVIVFVLTALTIFVKCNVNRRNSRTRRRGDGGWDYEGVPS
jgi:hypothetical protein